MLARLQRQMWKKREAFVRKISARRTRGRQAEPVFASRVFASRVFALSALGRCCPVRGPLPVRPSVPWGCSLARARHAPFAAHRKRSCCLFRVPSSSPAVTVTVTLTHLPQGCSRVMRVTVRARFFRTARRFRKAKIRHSFSELNNICSETCGVRRRGRGRAGARFCPMGGPTSAMCSTKSSVPRKRLVGGSAFRPSCRVFARGTEGLGVRRDDVPVGVGWGLVVRDAALARAVDAQWGPFKGKLRAVRSELVHQEAGGRKCRQGQRRSPGGGMPTKPGAGDRQGGRSGARRKRREEPFPDG